MYFFLESSFEFSIPRDSCFVFVYEVLYSLIVVQLLMIGDEHYIVFIVILACDGDRAIFSHFEAVSWQ